jgi:hypothetical protein
MNQNELVNTVFPLGSADEIEKYLASQDFWRQPYEQGPYEALWGRTESNKHVLHVSIVRGRKAYTILEYDENLKPIGKAFWCEFS